MNPKQENTRHCISNLIVATFATVHRSWTNQRRPFESCYSTDKNSLQIQGKNEKLFQALPEHCTLFSEMLNTNKKKNTYPFEKIVCDFSLYNDFQSERSTWSSTPANYLKICLVFLCLRRNNQSNTVPPRQS